MCKRKLGNSIFTRNFNTIAIILRDFFISFEHMSDVNLRDHAPILIIHLFY